MTGIPDYATAPNANVAVNGISTAENMSPAGVNDALRQLMADSRAQWNDKEWFVFGGGSGPVTSSPVAAYVSATGFRIAGADVTAVYHVGRRVRASGALSGTLYGTITAAAFATDTTVTVAWDAGALVSEPLTVSLGATLTGRPALASQAQAPSVKSAAYTVVPGDHNRLIRAQTGAAGITITLPTAATGAFPGMTVKLRHDSGSGRLTVTPGASDRIFWPASDTAGYTTLLLPSIGDTVTLETDGIASWFITHERIRTECRVDRNGVDQVYGASTIAKVQLNNKALDTHGYFDATSSFRYTPQVPGVYGVAFHGRQDNLAGGSASGAIFKNGVDVAGDSNLFEGTGGVRDAAGFVLVEMNGTTDYIEMYWANFDPSGAHALLGSTQHTFLNVIRLG